MWVASVFWFGPGFIALRVAVFATILLGIAVTDAKHYLIPDGFTITGLLFGGAASLLGACLGVQDPPRVARRRHLRRVRRSRARSRSSAGSARSALKKEAMGFGDTTLMAMVGVALGPGRALLTIFVGAFFAAAAFLLVVYPVGYVRARASARRTRSGGAARAVRCFPCAGRALHSALWFNPPSAGISTALVLG